MQYVKQLPFVFVDTLNLYVEQRVRVDHHIQRFGDVGRQSLLVLPFGALHRLQEAGVIDIGLDLAQLAEIGTPGLTDAVVQHVRQRSVSQPQPAAWGDTVGFIAEAIRENTGEIGKQRLHHQFGVQR
ncbi:hypothetical protein D3C80_703220 [compost metagenome]